MFERDLAFHPPLMNAAGALGFAPDSRAPTPWEAFGAFLAGRLGTMVKGKGPPRLWIEPEVHAAREALPGNVRRRIRHLLGGLAAKPGKTFDRL